MDPADHLLPRTEPLVEAREVLETDHQVVASVELVERLHLRTEHLVVREVLEVEHPLALMELLALDHKVVASEEPVELLLLRTEHLEEAMEVHQVEAAYPTSIYHLALEVVDHPALMAPRTETDLVGAEVHHHLHMVLLELVEVPVDLEEMEVDDLQVRMVPQVPVEAVEAVTVVVDLELMETVEVVVTAVVVLELMATAEVVDTAVVVQELMATVEAVVMVVAALKLPHHQPLLVRQP